MKDAKIYIVYNFMAKKCMYILKGSIIYRYIMRSRMSVVWVNGWEINSIVDF